MNKITVHMTKEFLYDFLLFHAYSKFSGFLINILGLAIAFVGVFMYASGKTGLVSVAFYLLASVAFLGSMPFQLKKRAKKQVELNPEYREPVEFAAAFGESERNYPWEQILRAVVTPKTIGIYYEAERALIIPKQDFGEQFGDIFQMIARHLGMNRVRMR